MEKSQKEELLNNRGLNDRQKEQLSQLFALLDEADVEYYTLKVPIADLISPDDYEDQVEKFAAICVQSEVLTFDLYFPEKEWILNVDSIFEVCPYDSTTYCILPLIDTTIYGSLNKICESDYMCPKQEICESIKRKGYTYPYAQNENRFLMWNDSLLGNKAPGHLKDLNTRVDFLVGYSNAFFTELAGETFAKKKKQEKLEQFYADNPTWEDRRWQLFKEAVFQNTEIKPIERGGKIKNYELKSAFANPEEFDKIATKVDEWIAKLNPTAKLNSLIG